MTPPIRPLDSSPRRAAIARVLPFAIYIAFLALGGALADILSVDVRWMYGVQIACVMAALGYFWRDYGELVGGCELSGQRVSGVTGWLIAIGLGVAVWMLWIWLDFSPFALAPGKGYMPLDEHGALIVSMVLVRIFGAAVIVPVMEELFWRSFVMRWIDNPNFLAVAASSVTLRSLVFSSLAFGFEHGQWAAGIVAGLAYGWLYRAGGSLWLPIVSHGLTNLLLGLWVVRSAQWHFW